MSTWINNPYRFEPILITNVNKTIRSPIFFQRTSSFLGHINLITWKILFFKLRRCNPLFNFHENWGKGKATTKPFMGAMSFGAIGGWCAEIHAFKDLQKRKNSYTIKRRSNVEESTCIVAYILRPRMGKPCKAWDQWSHGILHQY